MKRAFLTVSLLLSVAACGADAGEGSLQFEVWGEEFIEDGIPEDEFEDGWSARYDKFLIVLGKVQVARPGGDVGGRLQELRLYNLVKPGPHAVGVLEGLAEGPWEEVGYQTAAATKNTERHASASASDLSRMIDGKFSVYVEGSATKGDTVKNFAWGFSHKVSYEKCVDVSGSREVQGVSVGDGTTRTHQLTIHGDHLFYDDLGSSDAVLRFEALAGADTDDDGAVTLDELAEVRLSEIPTEHGRYATGALDVDTLAEYLAAATLSLGHFDGEGHCSVRVGR